MIRSTTLRSFFFASAFACLGTASASHLCGGEIYYTLQAGGSCQIDVHLYAATTSNGNAINLDPGDGSVVVLSLINVDTLPGYCCNYRLEYSGMHTFAIAGTYTLQTELSTRSADLLNIPNPTNQSLCISTMLTIPDLNTSNTSVRFTNAQPDVYFAGNTIVHEVNAYDADGDSLSFSLGIPTGNFCGPLNPYFLPHEVGAGNDTSWIDAATGTFSLQDPWLLGAHVLLIRGSEWRNGVLLGRVQRDMKLCVNVLTGTESIEPSATALLVATPTVGVFTFAQSGPGVVHASVLDAGGRLAQPTRTVTAGALLDLRALADGVYVVHCTDRSGAINAQRVLLTR